MTNNKKTTYSLGIVLLAAVLGVLVGLMFGPKLSRDNRDSFYDFSNSSPIDQMMSLVENTYVDSIDRDSLTTMAMSSLLSSLDPHSTFLPPKSFEEGMQEVPPTKRVYMPATVSSMSTPPRCRVRALPAFRAMW